MALERQMNHPISEIDAKHVARYAWASQFVVGNHVLDAACGCGYGSWLLATVARSVRGIDRGEEAIAYAMAHYTSENVNYMPFDLNEDKFPFAGFQTVVSLETIEHLDRPVEETLVLFREALCPGGTLCISHPINEPVVPEGHNPFHKQFWIDDAALKAQMAPLGFEVLESKRQPGGRMYDYHLLALRKA